MSSDGAPEPPEYSQVHLGRDSSSLWHKLMVDHSPHIPKDDQHCLEDSLFTAHFGGPCLSWKEPAAWLLLVLQVIHKHPAFVAHNHPWQQGWVTLETPPILPWNHRTHLLLSVSWCGIQQALFFLKCSCFNALCTVVLPIIAWAASWQTVCVLFWSRKFLNWPVLAAVNLVGLPDQGLSVTWVWPWANQFHHFRIDVPLRAFCWKTFCTWDTVSALERPELKQNLILFRCSKRNSCSHTLTCAMTATWTESEGRPHLILTRLSNFQSQQTCSKKMLHVSLMGRHMLKKIDEVWTILKYSKKYVKPTLRMSLVHKPSTDFLGGTNVTTQQGRDHTRIFGASMYVACSFNFAQTCFWPWYSFFLQFFFLTFALRSSASTLVRCLSLLTACLADQNKLLSFDRPVGAAHFGGSRLSHDEGEGSAKSWDQILCSKWINPTWHSA